MSALAEKALFFTSTEPIEHLYSFVCFYAFIIQSTVYLWTNMLVSTFCVLSHFF